MAYSPITNPLPTTLSGSPTVTIGADPDTVGTGSITAADIVVAAPPGTGAMVSGTPTANSYVVLSCPGGDTAWNTQVTGTFGGATVYWEASLDSTNGTDGNWINVNGRQTGVVNTVLGYSTTVAGLFRGNASGIKYLRARAVGGAAINIAVVMRVSAGTGAVFLNASIPAGTNVMGKFGIDQTTPGTTNAVSITNASLAVTGTFFPATQPVSLVTLPALTTGAAVIGAVTQSGTWNIGSITTLPALAAGAAAIGTVGVTSLPATPAGANDIGYTGPARLTAGTNFSGSITTGGTAQTLAAANANRRALKIQNTSTADLMVTEFSALTPSITVGYKLTAGSAANINTNDIVKIWGATTGQTFAATEI